MNAPRRFFFYGTLLHALGNPLARRIHAHLRLVGEAHARGALFAIPDPQGCYPALVAGEGKVVGALYRALPGFGVAQLAELDRYEGVNAGVSMRGEYRRVVLAVHGRNGSAVLAQAYRYQHRLPRAAVRIEDGDFSRWLGRTGAIAFRGS